jgi:hypothetical protein
MKTIQIGLAVHKAIEAERQSLAETEDAILGRLLFGVSIEAKESNATDGAERYTGKGWAKDGVDLPEGTALRARYSGQTVHGEVVDGSWLIAEKRYDSPSMALIHNVRTKAGLKTNINGWRHWMVKRPSDEDYKSLRGLRGF